jgi:hypothetical protein
MAQKCTLAVMAAGLSVLATPAWAENFTSASNGDASLIGAAFSVAPQTRGGGFALSPGAPDLKRPLQPQAFSAGPVRWSDQSLQTPVTAGAVDTVRLSVSESRATPSASALLGGPYRTDGFDLSYTRGWPQAVHFDAGRYGVAISPHAGVGLSNLGPGLEAGAMVKVQAGKKSAEDRLGDLGVKDGRAYGEEGRWYLFAAASGRSVGLNMTRSEAGWNQAGWSTDKTAKMIGDGQLGVGFRKGAMQAAFGYVYREIKVQNGPLGADTDVSDSMAAFSLSLRPNW